MDDFITPAQARRFYDRIGHGLDARPLCERRALDALSEQGDFAHAGTVVEFGCGTGRFAARLLRERLPDGAAYLGLDVSPGMVRLAGAAVAPWAGRAGSSAPGAPSSWRASPRGARRRRAWSPASGPQSGRSTARCSAAAALSSSGA